MITEDLNTIQEKLLSGTVSVTSLVNTYLENIEKFKDHNAYVEVFTQEALAAARKLDERIKNHPNDLGELFGAVISIKDNLCYKGHHVTAGSKMLDGFESPYSSTAVDRLLSADAIVIGRTNCDEFSMGSTSESSFYGPVKNALDKTCVAGGSSGGAAVAVKLNTCMAALGSDTGGSIRQPAAFNGVIGYKPTYGLISRWGLVAYASSFDVIGVLAKDVKTISMITNVVSGADDYDSTAIQDPIPKFNCSDIQVEGKKVAFLNELVSHPKLSDNARNAFEGFTQKLKDNSIDVEGVSFEYTDYLVPAYYILCAAEASSNLSRFDGVRYGYRADGTFEDYRDMIKQSRTEGFGKEVKKRIILGNYVLSEGHFDAYFTKAMQIRQIIKTAVEEIFEQFDYIILPTSTSQAWLLGDAEKDPIAMYLSDMYTVLANLSGIPAISIPLTNKDGALPLGIQIMAKSKSDNSLLEFVNAIHEAI